MVDSWLTVVVSTSIGIESYLESKHRSVALLVRKKPKVHTTRSSEEEGIRVITSIVIEETVMFSLRKPLCTPISILLSCCKSGNTQDHSGAD